VGEDIKQLLTSVEAEIDAHETKLAEVLVATPEDAVKARLVQTVPGVGPVTAAALVMSALELLRASPARENLRLRRNLRRTTLSCVLVRLFTRPPGGEMKRRNILKGLGLGIGGASVPWLSAFGLTEENGELCEQARQSGPMSAAPVATDPEPIEPELTDPEPSAPAQTTLSAKTSARPRLYLVVPKDPNLRYLRGRAFGEFFNHGAEAHLARLAIFEVVCATTDEIKLLTGKAVRGEPWLVVVDRSAKRVRPVPLDDAELSRLTEADVKTRGDEQIDVIDERIRRLGELVVAAIDPEMIERMVAAEARSIGASLHEELSLVIEQSLVPRMAVVEAAPATLLKSSYPAKEPDDDWRLAYNRTILAPRLAELTRDHLVRSQPPTGARWARSSGCGTRVEGVRSNVRIGCGMGHVPERSQRFLSFLVDSEGS